MDDPVQAQLEAYNAGDLEAFVSCYHHDVVVTDAFGTQLMTGIDAFRAAYATMFDANPDLRADVVSRQRSGGWTIDQERVSRQGAEVLEVLVAYLVEHGLIRRVVMFR